MTLDEIRRELESADGLPREALAAAVGQAAALAPEVITLMEKAVEGICLMPKQENLLFFGLHALAAAKETTAYRSFVTLLLEPEEELDRLLGNALTENGPGLLLGLFDGDVEPIYAALESPDTIGVIKWILFQVLARLVWEGRAERERFIELIDRFDREQMASTNDLVWYGWEDAIMYLGLGEFRSRVQRGWEAGRISNEEDDGADWLTQLDQAIADPDNPERFSSDRIEPITDPVASLDWIRPSSPTGLKKRSGPRDPAEAIELNESELDWLDRFLGSLQVPDSTLSLETVDGFFMALLAGPETMLPAECIGKIWGPGDGDGPAYDSPEQMQFVTELLMRHWNSIAARLDAMFPHEPIIHDYGTEDTGSWWALGFILGVNLRRDAWMPLIQHEDAGALVATIAILAADRDQQEGKGFTAEDRAEILDQLPVSVLAMRNFWRKGGTLPRRATPVRSAKVGRNEPCPCGSGRKYKKCCGADAA